MTDVSTAGEMPIEPVPPIPPPPEAIAEVEAAVQAVAGPELDQPAPADDSLRHGGVSPDPADTPAEQVAERALPFPDVEHLGVLRRAVLDALIDNERPLSVAEIIAHMPVGTSRGSAESAIKREFDAGRIERVAPGVYWLAPAKPPEAKPAPQPELVRADGISDEQWLTWLHEWRATSRWEGPGNPPGQSGCAVPPSVIAKHNDRVRKRIERQREAEAAAAKRTAADAELRDRLIAATGGNVIRGPALDDVAPIKLALELVPIDRILSSIRNTTDRKMYPKNESASSWGERRLLKAIAEDYCGSVLVPRLVDAWSKAGKAPAPTAQSLPPADLMPDDLDELRRLHDSPSAPPGPHSLPGDVPMPAPANATDTSEAPAAVSAPLEQESAPASSPPQPVAVPDDGLAIDAEPAAVDAKPRAAPAKEAFQTTPCGSPAKPPAEPTRESIMAAFNRPRQPQPAPPQHQPAQRQAERPWFAGERQATPEPEMSDEGWEELIAGFVAGNINWNARRLGPEPGNHGCRAPQSVLRRYRL